MAGAGLVEQGWAAGCWVVERTIRVKHNRKKYEGSMVGLLLAAGLGQSHQN